MTDGDTSSKATASDPNGSASKSDSGVYAPTHAPDKKAESAATAFDPGVTIEDPELATRTIVRATDAPSLGRTAPGPTGAVVSERYRLDAHLGATTGGQAFAGQDAVLDRRVTVKVLPASRALDPMRRQRFFHEARIAARLHHPGITPIYDLDQTPGGDLYFTSGQAGGMTLAEAMRLTSAGSRPGCIATWRHVATVLLKTGEAVAQAHDQGILHRDLKPEHLAIGDTGEVLVAGWQWACEVDPNNGTTPAVVVGTPLWMSPEQARGEAADRRSDVYALGSLLFAALTGEAPIQEADEELFWKLKRSGRVPEALLARHAQVAPHLMACALAAMDPFPSHRPADARAFVDSLLAALDRQISKDLISSHERSKSRRRLLWAATLALTLAGAGSLAAGPVLRWWRQPPVILASDFTAPQLPEQLRVLKDFAPTADATLSAWTVSDGSLVSSGPFHNYIFFDRMLSGRIEVTCNARWNRSAPVGEISLVWVPRDPFTSDEPLKGSSYLQIGAWDNEYSSIYLNNYSTGLGGARATVADFMLEPDRDYAVRFIIDGSLYRIEVDGRTVSEFHDPSVPQRSGWIGLYATRAGKHIDDLSIRSEPNSMVPLTAIPEAFLRDGLTDAAVAEFERISRSLGGAMSDEAMYRQGVALVQAKREDEARRVWDAIRAPPWSEVAAVRALDLDFLAGRHDAVLAGIRGLYSSPTARMQVHVAWSRFVLNLALTRSLPAVDDYLNLERQLFQPDKAVRKAAATALVSLGRHAEVIERFSDCASESAQALLALGRDQEVIDRYPGRLTEVERAKLDLGRLTEVADGLLSQNHQLALLLLARPADVLAEARFPGSSLHILAAASLGRWDEAVKFGSAADRASLELLPLLATGRYNEALATKPGPAYGIRTSLLLRAGRGETARELGRDLRQVLQWQVIDAISRGDAAKATTFRQELAKLPLPMHVEQPGWLTDLILLPLADQLAGDGTAFERAKQGIATEHPRHWAGLAWHTAMHIGGLIDDVRFRNQPVRRLIPALERICQAVSAELAGKGEEARVQWQAYLDLPYPQRLWGSVLGDPAVDRFAQWRAGVGDAR